MLTNPYENRRKRYREGIDDTADALDEVQQGLAAIDKQQKDAAAFREQQRKTARSEKREDAATERQSRLDVKNEEDRQRNITRTNENDAAVRAERAAREAELKRKTDAADKEAKKQKAITEAGAGMQRGLSSADLSRLAVDAEMSPEALLKAVDDIETGRRQAESDRAAKAAKEKSETGRAWAAQKETERHNRATEENARAAAEAAKTKADDKTSKLTAGETEGIVELNQGLAMLERVKSMKEGTDGGAPIDTGPIATFIEWGKNKLLGGGDPRFTEFKATVGAQLADYIKSISGATVGVEERAALLENVPTATDNDETFMAKLQSVKNQLDNKLKTKRSAYEAMGKDTRAFGAGASDSGTVTVTDGKETLTIPRADLADAIKDGFREVK